MADRLDWTDGEIGGGDFDGASGLYDEGYEGYEGEGYETCLGGPTHSGPAVTRDPLGRLFLVVVFADGSYRFRSRSVRSRRRGRARPARARRSACPTGSRSAASSRRSRRSCATPRDSCTSSAAASTSSCTTATRWRTRRGRTRAWCAASHTQAASRHPLDTHLTHRLPLTPLPSPRSPLPSPLAQPLSPSWARDARRRGTRGCTWAGRSRRRRRRCSTMSR